MKVRYSINDRGELADRDGNVLGKLTSLTLDVGTTGVGLEVREQQQQGQTPPPDPQVLEVWQHYVEVFDAGRQELNPQRRRDIERALKVRDVAALKRSIDGLKASPHHNGQNETGQKYTDIRYALRGNSQRGETPEERIDRMGQLAGGSTGVRSATTQARVDEAKRDVMAAWHRDRSRPAPTRDVLDRGQAAIARLLEHGIKVQYGEGGRPMFKEAA